MKPLRYALGALAGVVCGFFLGELVAIALGITSNIVFDASLPLALKLMPFYLAAVGVLVGPYLASRSGGGVRR